MLAKVYLLGRLPSAERGACIAVLRDRIAADADRLATLEDELDPAEIPEGAHEVYRYRRATLDYGIRSHALAAQWLDELEQT